jgi:GntR family transcriptional repressor for pyruvate dehydrogenase complex
MASLNPGSANLPSPRRSANRSTELADHLEQIIRAGKFPAGQKLPSESELRLQHHLSRSVIREALSQLQARGLVETRHGIGTFTLPTPKNPTLPPLPEAASAQDIISIMELRISIESEAAALAAARHTPAQAEHLRSLTSELTRHTSLQVPAQELDQQFHLLITQATANPYLIQILASLAESLIPRSRLHASYAASGRSANFLQRRDAEHTEICNAILRRDPVAASAAMRLHLSNSRERLLEIFQSHP